MKSNRLTLAIDNKQTLNRLARITGFSLTETIRAAISLFKLIHEEVKLGNKVIVVNQKGKPKTELVFPDL